MAIYRNLSVDEFIQYFKDMDRDYYSLEAYDILFDWYGGNDETENTELDVISICGEWDEYKFRDFDNLISRYEILAGISLDTSADEKREKIIEILENHTTVFVLENEGILVRAF